jgi:hypothetical protein
MLLRIVLYLTSVIFTHKVIGYVFNRNQLAGIYPAEADSIGIPIFENQIFLGVLTILIIPTAAFGSCWVFNTLFNSHSVFRLLGLIAVAALYVMGLLVSIGMALSNMDKAHIELGLSYAGMVAVLATFFFRDGVRNYREIHRRRWMETKIL